jgi:hypothetical protein
MYFENANNERETKVLPLNLTAEAAKEFPEAVRLAQSLEADRASLEPIKQYLIRKQELSEDQADHALTEYLKYMVLAKATREPLAPSDEADTAWHAHILHTQLYEPFCRRHFGRFMHHVPSDPNTHPPDEFFRKQNQLGKLFYGSHTIYISHHSCNNHHSCAHPCAPGHCVPGQTCTVN